MNPFLAFAFASLILATVPATAPAAEQPPALSLGKAANLAEVAIASASLPADCFLRSMELVRKPDPATFYRTTSPPYYRATFRPPPEQPSRLVDPVSQTVTVEIIRIAMDGKVSFEKEEIPRLSILVE